MTEKLDDEEPMLTKLRQDLSPPEGAADRVSAAALAAPSVAGSRARLLRMSAILAAAGLLSFIWLNTQARRRRIPRIVNAGSIVIAVGSHGERWMVSGTGAEHRPTGMILISRGGVQ